MSEIPLWLHSLCCDIDAFIWCIKEKDIIPPWNDWLDDFVKLREIHTRHTDSDQ